MKPETGKGVVLCHIVHFAGQAYPVHVRYLKHKSQCASLVELP